MLCLGGRDTKTSPRRIPTKVPRKWPRLGDLENRLTRRMALYPMRKLLHASTNPVHCAPPPFLTPVNLLSHAIPGPFAWFPIACFLFSMFGVVMVAKTYIIYPFGLYPAFVVHLFQSCFLCFIFMKRVALCLELSICAVCFYLGKGL